MTDTSVEKLIDFLAKLNIIDYRLRNTDEILDRIGRKWKMEQFNQDNFIPKNPQDPNGEHILSESANKKFKDWNQINQMLFHVLVVNIYNLNEVIKNLKNIEHPKLKQIHESLKPCLDALEKKENLIKNWRSNITAHGKLYSDEIHGPVDITIRTKKFQKTVYLLTKLGNMYISAIKNNLTEEQKKAVRKLGRKWKSESEIYIEDYFEQLQRASQIRKTVVTKLSKAGLNTDVSFVEYRSGRKIS